MLFSPEYKEQHLFYECEILILDLFYFYHVK